MKIYSFIQLFMCFLRIQIGEKLKIIEIIAHEVIVKCPEKIFIEAKVNFSVAIVYDSMRSMRVFVQETMKFIHKLSFI